MNLAPTHIPIGPVPTAISTGRVDVEGHPLVAVQVVTPSGMQVYLIDADTAVVVGEQLAEQGRAARAGITIASPTDIPPKSKLEIR